MFVFTYRERVQHRSVRSDVGDGVDGGEVVNKLAAKLHVQGRDGTYKNNFKKTFKGEFAT